MDDIKFMPKANEPLTHSINTNLEREHLFRTGKMWLDVSRDREIFMAVRVNLPAKRLANRSNKYQPQIPQPHGNRVGEALPKNKTYLEESV